MLTHLTIRHFAIFKYVDIKLKPGFTIFSGETGAGKSLLIDALTFALGGKVEVPKNSQEENLPEVSVSATSNPSVSQILKKIGIPNHDEDHISIQRIIQKSGKTRTFLNGILVSTSQLKEITPYLISIHSQHDHILLAEQKMQREFIDNHAGTNFLTEEVKKAWKQYQEKKKQYEQIKKDAQNLEKIKEDLTWRLEQLENLNPHNEEWDTLNQEYLRLQHAVDLVNDANNIYCCLEKNDQALIKIFKQLSHRLSMLANLDKTLSSISNIFSEIEIQLQESSKMLAHYLQKIDIDPIKLQIIEKRVGLWLKISHQLGIKPEKVYEKRQELQDKLISYEESSKINFFLEETEKAKKNYEIHANKLSKQRQAFVKRLEKEMNEALQSLSMNNATFKIVLESIKNGSLHGNEEIKFRLATHKGTEPLDLIKISSGGELSRIALALIVAAKADNQIPTMIFDEIDSGIGGGSIAEIVGNMLSYLSKERQVLCITHLPQIAAQSQHHYHIYKSVDKNGNTLSNICEYATDEEKINEIARMSTGIKITKTAIEHAREMFFGVKK